MPMIKISTSGDFKKTRNWLFGNYKRDFRHLLNHYAKVGLNSLIQATPVDTGKTASSWGYYITYKKEYVAITWTNDNINEGVPIAVILQYGHATGWGKYVKGIDYINPAIQPVFHSIADSIWKEVTEDEY